MKRLAASFVAFAALTGLTLAACNSGLTVLPGVAPGLFAGPRPAASVQPFVPARITLDVSELPDDAQTTTGSAKSIAAMETSGAAIDRALRAGAEVVHAFQRFADRALQIGASVQDDLTSADANSVAQGVLDLDGKSIPYVASFAAFDFDGDGAPDGSGSADAAPVAFRLWINHGNGYERFLCALFDKRPTSADDAGAGRLIVWPRSRDGSVSDAVKIHVWWDHSDPAHRWNEAVVSGAMSAFTDVIGSHDRVDIRTDESGHTTKTVRSTTLLALSRYGFTALSFAAFYPEDGAFALVSAQSQGGTIQAGFDKACVGLEDRLRAAAVDSCEDLDAPDLDFLPAPAGDEADFPADFPDKPTPVLSTPADAEADE